MKNLFKIALMMILTQARLSAQTDQKFTLQFGGGFTTPVFTNHQEDGRRNGFALNSSVAYEMNKSSTLMLDIGYTLLSYRSYQYPVYTLDYYEKALITDHDHNSSFLNITLNLKFKPWLQDWPNTYIIAGYGFVRCRMPDLYYYPPYFYAVDVKFGSPPSHVKYGTTYHAGIGKTIPLSRGSDLLIEIVYRENVIDNSDYSYGSYPANHKIHLRDTSLRTGIQFHL